MSRDVNQRIGRNEGLFRKVNEAIARGLWPGDAERVIAFRCECARLDCNSAVHVSLAEYEEVRAHPRRFMLLPGHQYPSAETVVETRPSYLVVEKRQEAGVVVDRMDPRS